MKIQLKPEALRLADLIHCGDDKCQCSLNLAAAELLRLHAENAQLREQNTALDAACANLESVRGTPTAGGEPAGTVGYTVHGTHYVNWRTKPPAHGTTLYTSPQPVREPLTPEQITAAAKVLAESMDYPWEFMAPRGQAEMGKHVLAVLESVGITGGQHD